MMSTPRTVCPLDTYSNLLTSIPQWTTDLTSLREHVIVKHAEFVAEYKRILAHARPKRRKSASIRSIRTSENKHDAEVPAIEVSSAEPGSPPPADPVEISPFEAGNRYLYAQVRRKRKSTSSMRSGASGPQNFRTKQMVVIYYDAQVQIQFEAMVQALGAARNELRKARQADSLSRGLALPRLTRRRDQTHSALSNTPLQETKTSTPLDLSDKTDANSPQSNTLLDAHADSTFLSIDKDLESVQTLCETAAHQFLRDGDCKIELDASLAHFESVIKIIKQVKTQLEKEKRAKEDVEAREAAEQEREKRRILYKGLLPDDTPFPGRTEADSEETLQGSQYTTDLGDVLPPSKDPAMEIGLSSHPPPLMGLGTDEIEVDDDGSDMSDIEVDMKQFRMARATGMRV